MVKGRPSKNSLKKLLAGIMLEDGLAKAHSASYFEDVEFAQKSFMRIPDGHSLVEIEVREGRNHFVKNIFKAIGFPVVRLCRTEFGPYTLEGVKSGKLKEIKFMDAGPRSLKKRRG
jgi:pseudouridine synthase